MGDMEGRLALNELARELYKVCHLRGEFTLRSGRTSTDYFDKYRFEAQPSLLKPVEVPGGLARQFTAMHTVISGGSLATLCCDCDTNDRCPVC